MSVLLVDMRQAVGNGLTIRPVRTMINHATTELFFEDLRVPAANLIGEAGKGFRYILDGMNAERILDRGGVHRRREVLHRPRQSAYAKRAGNVRLRRSVRTKACSSRSPGPTSR